MARIPSWLPRATAREAVYQTDALVNPESSAPGRRHQVQKGCSKGRVVASAAKPQKMSLRQNPDPIARRRDLAEVPLYRAMEGTTATRAVPAINGPHFREVAPSGAIREGKSLERMIAAK
jgi:hypothetical protein